MPDQTRVRSRDHRDHKGAITVLVALLLPVLIMVMAFAINVAWMELARTELQVATDAAVRAGGRTYAMTGSMTDAIAAARDAGSRNSVAGVPLRLKNSDLVFGVANRPNLSSRYSFTASNGACNALQLTSRRTTGSLDGPVPMLLPSILGTSRFQPTQNAMATQVELDVALVVDRSGSMAYANNESSNTFAMPAAAPAGWQFGNAAPNPSRWRDAAAAVLEFINVLNQSPLLENVSLTTYGDAAARDVPLTTNYNNIQVALAYYTVAFNEGRTNIGGGISAALDSLRTDSVARTWATKVIVVLTDGIHTVGYDPISAAYEARDAGVTVFTVTFSSEADQYRMGQVAEIASGQHFHAVTQSDLISAFQTIAKGLPTLIAK